MCPAKNTEGRGGEASAVEGHGGSDGSNLKSCNHLPLTPPTSLNSDDGEHARVGMCVCARACARGGGGDEQKGNALQSDWHGCAGQPDHEEVEGTCQKWKPRATNTGPLSPALQDLHEPRGSLWSAPGHGIRIYHKFI